jgi:transposase
MTIEEELRVLREEKKHLREQVAQRDARIQQLEAMLEQQNILLEQMQDQMNHLSQQVKSLQERQSKDSHNSHLPPSSDRFVRQPKSLRKKSGKKSGGQPGHLGTPKSSLVAVVWSISGLLSLAEWTEHRERRVRLPR